MKLLFIVICVFDSIYSFQQQFSVFIEEGKMECFHQYIHSNMNIATDYQIIWGKGTLVYLVTSPDPVYNVIFNDTVIYGGYAAFKTEYGGIHDFCFDNRQNGQKRVFFYISSDDFEDSLFQKKSISQIKGYLDKDDLDDIANKLGDIRLTFQRIVDFLEQAQRIQNVFRSYEGRDRSLMEENLHRVNFWSLFNIILMMFLGFTQVLMIKSLFENKSKIGKVLRIGINSHSK